MKPSYTCASCRNALKPNSKLRNGALKRTYTRPSFAPKPVIDLKHIRQNPGLYEQNCIDRNYPAQAKNAWRILELHTQIADTQKEALELRRKSKDVRTNIERDGGTHGSDPVMGRLLEEAKKLKTDLNRFVRLEGAVKDEMEALAIEIPNLSSSVTPVGDMPEIIGNINDMSPSTASRKSHVEIGKELDILDFEASAATSGWGWYFLKNEGALLEQALIQYALNVALMNGWRVTTPPSLVYDHIASACGFMPRDQNGETQRYSIAGESANADPEKPGLVLAGTAEIPLAGSQANKTLTEKELPLKLVGPSRCYRAEAGARGVETKGLYRVHEFTKVEMFAWTTPPITSDEGRLGSDEEIPTSQTDIVFNEMLAIQTEILTGLGLHAKILEMPTTDLGASASRKVDIEAFFPSRVSINDGYGEVTSASICTDYQSRRLGTRLKDGARGGTLGWPHTVNGTALAVPRVLACILENRWEEATRTVDIPEVLRPYMLGGIEKIGSKR